MGSYTRWRSELYTKTLHTLKSIEQLSDLNKIGCFHKVNNNEVIKKMQEEYKSNKELPSTWISKGNFPGIWTALFNPHNTYSINIGEICILQFYFRENFFIFDGQNESHQELLDKWKNNARENPWSKAFNESKESLEQRTKKGFYKPFPSHRAFYEDNKFGCAIGYSDYISAVLFLEESVKKVKFLEL